MEIKGGKKYIFLNFIYLINMTCFVCLFDLILYFSSTIFQLCREESFWVEPVLN